MPSWKMVLGIFVLGFLSFCTLVGIAYAMTPVPDDPTVKGVTDQGSVFYFRDGKTVIGKIGTKRQNVSINTVPKHVQDAVLAAENRSFRSDPGFNTKAIARAVWVNATGGSTQGGSTITQQLAKNYYSDMNNRTMKRKFQELFISIKLEEKYKSKDKILELYLNTIYFGRNTYGIQAASQEYFHKDVGKLTKQEAALLGGIIQNPNRDPASSAQKAWAQERYKYTLEGLVKMGALPRAEADRYATKVPAVHKPNKSSVFAGQNGYLLRRSINAVAALGITEEMLGKNGYHIVTTWDQGLQNHMAKVVKGFMKNHDLPKSIHVGTTSIDASSGEILAAYGGKDYLDQAWDDAYNSQVQAGSSFKSYVLAAALKEGIGLRSIWDTDSPRGFNMDGSVNPSSPLKIRNASGRGYGPRDLIYSTANSLNTVYYPLGLKVGLDDVVETSVRAGISKNSPGLSARQAAGGLSLGIASVSPLDQASAYATFANNGVYRTPHSIKKVYVDAAKKKLYKRQPKIDKRDAFGDKSDGIAADVTYALRQVVNNGTGTKARLSNGAPVAGKTGTTNEAKAVWFVGYTPKISTSVAMWKQKTTKKGPVFEPLQGIGGYSEVHGGDLPAAIWHDYMTTAASGDQGEFPAPQYVGADTRFATTKPSASPTDIPTCKPGQQSRPRIGKPCKPDPRPGYPCRRGTQLPPGCNPDLPQQPPPKYCNKFPKLPGCPPTGPGPGPSGPDPRDAAPQDFLARPPE